VKSKSLISRGSRVGQRVKPIGKPGPKGIGRVLEAAPSPGLLGGCVANNERVVDKEEAFLRRL